MGADLAVSKGDRRSLLPTPTDGATKELALALTAAPELWRDMRSEPDAASFLRPE